MSNHSSDAWARPKEDQSYLHDLTEVLRAHPGGLRRWSVMRAMRARRSASEITPRFEDDVERVFRRNCKEESIRISGDNGIKRFHRPENKAGEVWAACPCLAT
jgi:hypothetical protein